MTTAEKATHAFTKIGQPKKLGPLLEGPLPIREKVGNACVKVGAGFTAGEQERIKLQHWNNVKQAFVVPETPNAQQVNCSQKPWTRANAVRIAEINEYDRQTEFQIRQYYIGDADIVPA